MMQEQVEGAFVTAMQDESMPPDSTPSESVVVATSSYATFSENGTRLLKDY
jgi:hypothetical protein